MEVGWLEHFLLGFADPGTVLDPGIALGTALDPGTVQETVLDLGIALMVASLAFQREVLVGLGETEID